MCSSGPKLAARSTRAACEGKPDPGPHLQELQQPAQLVCGGHLDVGDGEAVRNPAGLAGLRLALPSTSRPARGRWLASCLAAGTLQPRVRGSVQKLHAHCSPGARTGGQTAQLHVVAQQLCRRACSLPCTAEHMQLRPRQPFCCCPKLLKQSSQVNQQSHDFHSAESTRSLMP